MYRFQYEEDHDKFSVVLSVDHLGIRDILDSFKDFLRGCSFSDTLVDRIQYIENTIKPFNETEAYIQAILNKDD